MNPSSNNLALSIGSFSNKELERFGTAFFVKISILNIVPLLHMA